MRTTLLVAALLAPLAVASGVQALLPCNGSVTTIGDGTSDTTIYIDDRNIETDGVWVYKESGRLAGLQSGGNSIILGSFDRDRCVWPVVTERDTLIV